MTSGWTPGRRSHPKARNDAISGRVRIDAGKLWAGGVATAVVAALIAIVGIVVARGVFHIAVLAPRQSGTWGDADTGTSAIAAFGIGVLATGLMHVLLISTPAPFTFFDWILAL